MGAIQSSLSGYVFDYNKPPKVSNDEDDEDWELLDDQVYYFRDGEQEAPKMNDKQPSPKPDRVKISAGRHARIVERAELMIHAGECKNELCLRPHCQTMKPVLIHNETCTLGDECTVLHCPSATQIKNHWKKCTLWDCPICWTSKKDAPIENKMIEGMDVNSWSEYHSIHCHCVNCSQTR